MRVVFDLDGTLALIDHRLHHVQQEPKDWEAFYAACADDEPCALVIRILHRHLEHDAVEIWTGRSDAVRRETEEWLRRNIFTAMLLANNQYAPVRALTHMRPAGDHQPDVELKRGWLREARAAGWSPDLAYEDRYTVAAMWREEGVPCFQVASRDF